ncbi:Flp pilus assembly protein TadG [Rhizobium mongolense subsp. loessense]|uniref:Flp pilus assembly protein TadG n=1 Tax=Rhizobium mongolense subsp. loessense TaxID=158890 RepID=A0A1G4U5P6_9HYPH|nr:TadE/TadG family type IV pilus assembly protein [Rhizobium mongolense]SCW88907.1 Flp pilus assembly protein TadG [Rhizobium mongolense subsp. loessense]
MSNPTPTPPALLSRKLSSIFREFLRNRNGASAIEFVLVFPIMVVLLAGTVDLGQALLVSRKMNQIAATVGDMVSQKATWKDDDVNAIIAGAATIIEPFDTRDLTIQLAIVDIDSDLVASVDWAEAYNSVALSKGAPSPVVIPPEIASAGVQLIAVNATYRLTTPFSGLLQIITGIDSYHYSKNYIMRPRIQDSVALKT